MRRISHRKKEVKESREVDGNGSMSNNKNKTYYELFAKIKK